MGDSGQRELFPAKCRPATRTGKAQKYPLEIGKRFGRLVVLAEAGYRNQCRYWLCRCDCGTEKEVQVSSLIRGRINSCGCLRTQLFTKHGMTDDPLHICWMNMHQRCRTPNHPGYADYGGRGIKVCERWNSFENFLADVGPRPSSEHSLDRYPNNDGDYEPGNVRWATKAEQMLNRRPRKRRTHCKRGHEYTEANTKVNKKGQWSCRTCARLLSRKKPP